MANVFEGDPFTRETSFANADAGATFGDRLTSLARTLNSGPSERVYADGGMPTFDNPLGAPEAASPARDAWGTLVSSAYNQARLANSWSSRVESLSDAADKRISIIRDETGMQLENPFRQGYHMEARKRLEDRRRTGDISSFGLTDVVAEQRAIFNEQVNLAAERFPDKAGKFWFYQSMEEQGRAIAANADAAAEQASAAVSNPFARFAGEIIGGIGAMVHDPVQVVGMFAGAGPSAARSMAARIGQTAAREALINAGLQALEEPAVQQWRAEIGLKSGLVPALENIGMAGLLGGALGGGIAGVRELLNPLRKVNLSPEDTQAILRVLDGSASPSETLRAIDAAKIEISPELRETIEVAHRAELADREALPRAPDGIDADAHSGALAQAVRAADDANVPPPSSPLSPLGRVGEAAPDLTAHPEAAAMLRAIEDGSASTLDAARLLREFPALDNGRLPIHGEEAQTLRGLAALSADAWTAVSEGRVSAGIAAMIGRIAPDRPELHAGLVSDLVKAAPQNTLEAAHVVYQVLASTQETNRLMAGANFDLWSQWASLRSEAERLRVDMRNEAKLAADAARMGGAAEIEGQISALQKTLESAKGKKADKLRERIANLESDLAAVQRDAPGGATTAAGRREEMRARLVEIDNALRDMVEPMAQLRQEAEAARISALRESFKDLGEPGTPQADYAAPKAEAVRRDTAENTGSKVEPPVPDGMVRVYHSGAAGEGETGRWVSTNRKYASDYRSHLPLFYLDIPETDRRIQGAWPDQGVKQGFTFNFQTTPEEAVRLREIDRVQPSPVASADKASAPELKPAPDLTTPPDAGLFDLFAAARADLAKAIDEDMARGARLDFAADVAAACKF